MWCSDKCQCDEEDAPCCLTKETHQPRLKCETDDCSFEACSQHVSKNRSSWESPKIDDFIKSEACRVGCKRTVSQKLHKRHSLRNDVGFGLS